MSMCSAKLACALANPFSTEAQGVCLPTAPARASRKVCGYIRGVGAIGSAGYGYVAISPCLANDYPSLYVTGTGYAGTGGTPFQPYISADTLRTGVNRFNCVNLPYAGSTMHPNTIESSGASVIGRIVCVGLKVTYIGALNTTAGIVCQYVDPSHNNTYSAFSGDSIPNRLETVICPTGPGESCQIALGPVQPEEYAFGNETLALANSGGNPASKEFQEGMAYPWCGTTINTANITTVAGGLVAGISIQNAAPSAGFYYEYTIHVEYVGSATEADSTPSTADSAGMQKVLAVAGRMPAIKAANPHEPWGKAFIRTLKEVGKEVAPLAGTAVAAMIQTAIAV